MMLKKSTFVLLIICLGIFAINTSMNSSSWNKDTPVYDVLFHFGEPKPDHYIDSLQDDLVEAGRQIVHLGKMKGARFISKYFVCTSCHNTVREDPNLSLVDQDARLTYAMNNKLPYLQGSTFWGMVNRETWYNDDYVKKYGDLVIKANKSLIESTQLCATVCSQGRGLKENEMKAILSYYWTLQLKMGDLDFSNEEIEKINKAYAKQSDRQSIIALIKSKYQTYSPATFGNAPQDKSKGYGLIGRPEKGEYIFKKSCMHCHRTDGESDVIYEDARSTYKWLRKHITDDSKLSIYQIIRYGTYANSSHREYMPNYTEEKMSDQQIEDLRSYIEQKSGNKN